MTQLLPTHPGAPDPATIPVTDEDQLADHLRSGCKAGPLRVGMEHEKFGVDRASTRPIPYEGVAGVSAILEGLAALPGYTRIHEGDRLVALVRGATSVSLEPGGQLELSGAPHAHLGDMERELDEHLRDVRRVAEPMGVVFYGMGFRPYVLATEVPRMPRARYRRMAEYLATAGTRGLEMMHSTATVQANLDFTSEADMGRKLRVAMGVSSVVTALWAASPFERGRPSGFKSRRMHAWGDVDNTRCGIQRFALDRDPTFRDYVQWALDVPLVFVRQGGVYAPPPPGLTFRRWMRGPDTVGLRVPSMADFTDLLSTLFPDVRLKTYLEVRTADAGSRAHLIALPALWKGLLYDAGAMARAWALVSRLTWEEHLAARDAAARDGLRGRAGGLDLGEAAVELVLTAQDGLRAQGAADEARLLDPMLERARRRTTLADDFLAHAGAPIDAALDLARLC